MCSLLLLRTLMELGVSFLCRQLFCLPLLLSIYLVCLAWSTAWPTTMERFICRGQEVPHDPSPSTFGTGSPRRKKQKMKRWLTSQLPSVQQYFGLEHPFCPMDSDLPQPLLPLSLGPRPLVPFLGIQKDLGDVKEVKTDSLGKDACCLILS